MQSSGCQLFYFFHSWLFHSSNQTRIVLYLCDGQRGDDDLYNQNGIIVDIGGPVQARDILVPTVSEWGMILFILRLSILAIGYLKRLPMGHWMR